MKLSVGKRDELLAALQEHRIDVVIAGFPPAHATVEAEAFARHPHCIVAAPGHRLAGQRGIPWEEVRNEPFIYREPGSATRQFLERGHAEYARLVPAPPARHTAVRHQ